MDSDPTSARSPDDDAHVDPLEDQLMRAPRAGVDPTLDPDPALYVPSVADGSTPPGEGPFPAGSRDLAARLREFPMSARPDLRDGDIHPLEGEVLGDAGGEILGGAGGAVTGGVIGAIVAGPLGAVAGGVIGAGAGAIAGRLSQGGTAGDMLADADESAATDTTHPTAATDRAGRGDVASARDVRNPDDRPKAGAPGPIVLDDDAELRALDDPDEPHLSEDREINP